MREGAEWRQGDGKGTRHKTQESLSPVGKGIKNSSIRKCNWCKVGPT